MRVYRQFPVISSRQRGPREAVPWSVMEIVRQDADREHSQTLERLAERGGLDWSEIGHLFVRHFAIEQGIMREFGDGGAYSAFRVDKPRAAARTETPMSDEDELLAQVQEADVEVQAWHVAEMLAAPDGSVPFGMANPLWGFPLNRRKNMAKQAGRIIALGLAAARTETP